MSQFQPTKIKAAAQIQALPYAVVKGRNRDTTWFAVTDGDWPALSAAFAAWLDPANFDAEGRQRRRLSDLTRPLLVAVDPGT